MTSIIITGAAGRMGKMLVTQVCTLKQYQLAGATESAESSVIGKDAGEVAGLGSCGVTLVSSLQDVFNKDVVKKNPVIIDFTLPEATMSHLKLAVSKKVSIVIGTTGFSAEQEVQIREASKKIPIVKAPNMSVGVNTLFQLVVEAAQILGEGYDLEIIEAHHRHKKDAPSGTAVRIGQLLSQVTKRSYPQDVKFHRHGIMGERNPREIGMQVIRGGDIVGEHTVLYCGEGERLEIKHVATSRKTFADGALRAAQWLVGQKNGLFDMGDVLGLKR